VFDKLLQALLDVRLVAENQIENDVVEVKLVLVVENVVNDIDLGY
jgi:hypothetical protein